MDKKDPSNHQAIIKAKELAEAIKESDAFKKQNAEELQLILMECNDIIVKTTRLNYGAICKPKSGCCG